MSSGSTSSDAALRRASSWLARHGEPGREPSALLTARLAVRRRADLVAGGAAMAGALVLFGWSVVRGRAGTGNDALDIALIAGGFALLTVGAFVALIWQRRADVEIGRELPRRVAPPAASSLRTIVGGWYAPAAATIYGGGLVVGLAGALFAVDPVDRAVLSVFSAAVVIYLVLAVAILRDVARRPVIATDADSLRDDALIRREDSYRGLVPFPAVLAFFIGVNSGSGDLLLAALLGYALISGMLSILVVMLAQRGEAHERAGLVVVR